MGCVGAGVGQKGWGIDHASAGLHPGGGDGPHIHTHTHTHTHTYTYIYTHTHRYGAEKINTSVPGSPRFLFFGRPPCPGHKVTQSYTSHRRAAAGRGCLGGLVLYGLSEYSSSSSFPNNGQRCSCRLPRGCVGSRWSVISAPWRLSLVTSRRLCRKYNAKSVILF